MQLEVQNECVRLLAELSSHSNVYHINRDMYFDICDRYGIIIRGKSYMIPSRWPLHR